MSMKNISDQWYLDVIEFWFKELSPKDWFVQDDQIDLAIINRFSDLFEQVSQDIPQQCQSSPEAALAAILVLDQFSRNMFRKSGKSFASDDKALSLAQQTISRGLDKDLFVEQRPFIYMPFMHSEDPFVQAHSIELFSALGNENNLKFAIAHRDVIERFKRFPHRNAVLERDSTDEEIAFLKQPGSSF